MAKTKVRKNGHSAHPQAPASSISMLHVASFQLLMQNLDRAKINYDPKLLVENSAYAAGKHNELRTWSDLTAWEAEVAKRGKSTDYGPPREPLPIVTCCPECGQQHIDAVDPATGIDWRRREHKRHRCVGLDGCGYEWQPALIDTVGVRNK